jgi:hypothetical protein
MEARVWLILVEGAEGFGGKARPVVFRADKRRFWRYFSGQ